MQSSEKILSTLNLERFFDEVSFNYDLAAGTVKNNAQRRIIYVSHDLMRGIYQALKEETAEAWKIIFKNCGRTWGKRVAAHLDAELAAVGRTAQAALPVETYVAFIEEYFAAHGWGALKLDLSAAAHGIVAARLRNSYFADVLHDVDDFVDSLLAGILQGFFEHVAGQELGAMEIACTRKGAKECVFVVTAQARLDAIESTVGIDTADAIIAALKK